MNDNQLTEVAAATSESQFVDMVGETRKGVGLQVEVGAFRESKGTFGVRAVAMLELLPQ